MTAAALLAELRALGATVAADGDRLAIDAPAGALTPALLARLRAHKPLILATLAADEPAVAWRVALPRAQLPASGPLPFLTARRTPGRGERCPRRGEPVEARTEGLGVCCAPCAHAAQLVVDEYQDGGARP